MNYNARRVPAALQAQRRDTTMEGVKSKKYYNLITYIFQVEDKLNRLKYLPRTKKAAMLNERADGFQPASPTSV